MNSYWVLSIFDVNDWSLGAFVVGRYWLWCTVGVLFSISSITASIDPMSILLIIFLSAEGLRSDYHFLLFSLPLELELWPFCNMDVPIVYRSRPRLHLHWCHHLSQMLYLQSFSSKCYTIFDVILTLKWLFPTDFEKIYHIIIIPSNLTPCCRHSHHLNTCVASVETGEKNGCSRFYTLQTMNFSTSTNGSKGCQKPSKFGAAYKWNNTRNYLSFLSYSDHRSSRKHPLMTM